MPSATLTCHPAAPSAGTYSIEAHARLSRRGELALGFNLRGDLARVRLPAPETPERRDHLWEHTCCEAFVGATDEAYLELNCSPAGSWNLYRFTRYRAGMREAGLSTVPAITLTRTAATVELTAVLEVDQLPDLHGRSRLELAIAVVLEEIDGRRSYWAVNHPAPKPDFHARTAFVVRVERGASEEVR